MKMFLIISLMFLTRQLSSSPIKSSSSLSSIDDMAIIAGLGVQYKDLDMSDIPLDIKDGSPVLPPLPPPMNTWEVLYPHQCSLPPFPMAVTDAVATATDNTILVCGGQDQNSKTLRSCHQLQDGLWSPAPPMMEARTNAASVRTREGWMVTGGSNGTGKFLDTMEMYQHSDGGWVKMTSKLPEAALGHCIVPINSTTVFLTGGYIKHSSGSGQIYSYQANMFNMETGEWRRMADMRQDRAWHECFVMGGNVVVAGGLIYGTERFVEVFDLKEEVWRNERDLPEDVDKAGSVKVGQDVMVIGAGDDDNKILRFMWIDGELRVTRPIEKYSKLKNGRAGGIFLKVNRKLLNCK